MTSPNFRDAQMQGATDTRTTDAMGRPFARAPKLIPVTVYGGWRLAYEDWTRTEDGWDCDYEFHGPVYATRELAEVAALSPMAVAA